MAKLLINCLLLSFCFFLVKSDEDCLPSNVTPLRYFLTMAPNMTVANWESGSCLGNVKIELRANYESYIIKLHAMNLEISAEEIFVEGSDGSRIGTLLTVTDPGATLLEIHLKNNLKAQELYNLTIANFKGNLHFDGKGFFMARYAYKEGDFKVIAATHFEPTWARKAFPCFDEPALKATFQINIVREKRFMSLSNEELDYTEDLHNGHEMDVFKVTPLMSTYTVAFAVSDFIGTKNWNDIGFWEAKNVLSGDFNYGLEMGVKTLQILENYTGVPYVLKKMDQFAVPRGYFQHHAMENWGLVIYGEEHLRINNKTRIEDLKRITSYISHEFAHQWFGNLVTAKYWNCLWLSESFAAYFQYYAASLLKPSWRLMDQFLIDVVYKSFHEEEFMGSEPLTGNITRLGQFPAFHIMYQKGSAVVRMMSYFLSPEIFQNGLHIYLKKHQFSSTVPQDLYASFQEALVEAKAEELLGNWNVSEIMESWENNEGFPLVTVTRNYTTGSITFTQHSLFHKNLWKIPINYAFSEQAPVDFTKTTPDFWLANETLTLDSDFPIEGWLLVNKQQTGYYRVNYDLRNWERIIAFLNSDKFEQIGKLTRAQLINDAFYFAHKNLIPIDVPLKLSEYLVNERDYIPFASFYSGFSSYLSFYPGNNDDKLLEYFEFHPVQNVILASEEQPGYYSTSYQYLRYYLKTVLRNAYEYLGEEDKPGESFLDKLHRKEILNYYPKNL